MKFKIFKETACFEVWLDEGNEDKTGICIGSSTTRTGAIEKAEMFLSNAQKLARHVKTSKPEPECYEVEE